MDWSIELYDETGCMAIEVNYEAGDYLLATKMKSFHRTFSQRLP